MNAAPLWLDFETFGTTDLKSAGGYRYTADARIQLCGYAIGDAPAKVIEWAGEAGSRELSAALYDSDSPLVAHNAQFDRLFVSPTISLKRWRCTMTQALAHSLPGALADLCTVLSIPADQAKLAEGHELVMLFCKPNKDGTINDRTTHPAEWERYKEYCRIDVEAMRACSRVMPKWNYAIHSEAETAAARELSLWHLDQLINDRGVAVDLELARTARDAAKKVKVLSDAEAAKQTGGAVTSMGQRDKLLKHILKQYGVDLPNMRAATLERRLEDPSLPEPLKDLIALRLSSTKASVAKYARVLKAICADERLHGLLLFCGADRTARWAGRIVQPQNFPRPPKEMTREIIDRGIDAIKAGIADLVLPDVLMAASCALRGVIIAGPGKKLVVADLRSIEGRVIAWLAGCTWKLQAYVDNDNGTGPDTYSLTFARTFNRALESVNSDERQIGKVEELSLQYQGAVGAFTAMAAGYGVELTEAEALAVVRGWRKSNYQIVNFWYALQAAAMAVIDGKGPREVGRVTLDKNGTFLRIRLPSGRYLSYPAARNVNGKFGVVPSYMGRHTYTKQWQRIETYGGKLAENITQAVARDILADAMPRVEAAGYPIVLTVHDEIITEVVDGDAETLCQIMSAGAPWSEGLPLSAAGFECTRYRKD